LPGISFGDDYGKLPCFERLELPESDTLRDAGGVIAAPRGPTRVETLHCLPAIQTLLAIACKILSLSAQISTEWLHLQQLGGKRAKNGFLTGLGKKQTKLQRILPSNKKKYISI
jgi:hypothetical protein